LVFGAVYLFVGLFQIDLIRMVEQSNEEFDAQDVTHSVINGGHWNSSFRDQFAKWQDV
jgi:hypothetical protein